MHQPTTHITDADATGRSTQQEELHGQLVKQRIPRTENDHAATRFRKLADEWRAATSFLSSVSDIAMQPPYQQIIGMGEVAIPLILEELRREPAQWFWALRSITGADPVPEASRGRIREMADAWLAWGHDHGYIE